jgi:hypothetical protein
MAQPVLNLFFSKVPADHPPTVPIRHVDVACGLGLFVACIVSYAIAWVLWRALPGLPIVPNGGLTWQWLHYPALIMWQLGQVMPHAPVTLWADNPASDNVTPLAVHLRLLPGFLVGCVAGGFALRAGLHPFSRMRHIEGPKLISDPKQALQELMQEAAKELIGKEPFMQILPGVWLPKQRWTRGVLLYGSPGSGKTQALIPIIEQLIQGNHRGFFYDVKGDFTSFWLGGTVGLICPQDRRSLVLDIGADVLTPSDAQVFASSLIGESGGEGKFWSEAAKSLLEGTLISLQNELGTNWGWSTLAERLAVDAKVMAERMAKHAPLAALLVADSQSSTTSSVLATLSAYTKIVHDLSRAWGDGRDEAGRMRPSISLRAWAKDGYDGKIRQLIFQAGQDKAMTTALGSAMLNLVLPMINSAATPDDELGRTLAFVLDEMPSLGPIPFQAAIERGRSKGVVFIGACQDLSQIEEVWGKETVRSLGSMIGTQLSFRISPSQGRDEVAEQFGKARWAVTAVSTSSSGQSTSVHEENRSVVQPYELSELGSIRNRKLPLGWGVTAILAGFGSNLVRVTFPGVTPEKRRTPHRPSKWTRGPSQPGMTPELTRVEREAKAVEMKKEYEAKTKARQEAKEKERDREKDRAADEEWRSGRKPAGNRNFVYEAHHEPEPGPPAASPPYDPASAAARLLEEGKNSPLAKLQQQA